ncbi:uncharacterized protein F4822DRAFT_443088 [Hypoxylon trugodes]|uniref:uncharacterized protein n=1 Tax=Hypoxylon trugodes TaxID=326681 RepID=UPI002191F14A|nr:uncharacterized protein F4822DRAFT_443088 [Hypoxylon trugodes]KAI1390097.1 hypothetical protein F4822DRAFT_443088 [Hypoxylon trugodes]
MKVLYALLSFAGAVSAAKSYVELSNGMYTVPYINETLDFENASRDAWDISADLSDAAAEATITNSTSTLAERGVPGDCLPQFPTRNTWCRERKIRRADYLRAYAKFLDWIETGPDEGWVPKHSCKSLVWGAVVLSACSTGGPNPTCRGELTEAMREVDAYCSTESGGDIQIKKWQKTYSRHNVRDGDGMNNGNYDKNGHNGRHFVIVDDQDVDDNGGLNDAVHQDDA